LRRQVAHLSADFGRLAGQLAALLPPAGANSAPKAQVSAARPIDSHIISDIPAIFAEFEKRRFSRLWRGGCDGFPRFRISPPMRRPRKHSDCDFGRGGFTPVEWESRVWNGKWGDDNNCWKADDSQRSFLFTLKNPHNIPARRFALKAEERHHAIYCGSGWGPYFGAGFDIAVLDNCNPNTLTVILDAAGLRRWSGSRGRKSLT
jgi:hypothetical protein